MFLWTDNVTKVTGNHTVKAGMSIERSGMNDRIQLSFATAPATTNQNGSFRFFDARAGGSGYSVANALLGLFDDYTEFGNKPNTRWLAMAYDWYAQDSWKPTHNLTLELGLRYSLWQPWGTTNQAMASFDNRFYTAATAATIDRPAASSTGGDRFNGIVLPGDAPSCRGDRDVPAAGEPAAAVSRRAERLLRNAEGRLPAAARTRVCHRRAHDVPRRRRPIPEPRADQHDRGLRLQSAAVGDADGHQRNGRRAGRRVDAQLPAGDGDAIARVHQPDVVGVEHHARSRAAVVDARHDLVRRPVGVEPRTRAQHQPIAAGHDSGQSRRQRQRAAAVSRLQHDHALRHDRPLALQQPPDAGRAPIDARRRLQRRLHLSRERRTTAPAATTCCPTPTTTAATTAFPISIARTCSCRRSAIISRRSNRRRRPLRWVLGNWDVSGIFQAQSGAPFDVRTAVDIAGVGPGSGNQFYDSIGDPNGVRTDWDDALSRATWFDKNAFRAPTAGTYATSQDKNFLRQPGFWDLNMSFRKGFDVAPARSISISGSRSSTSSTARVSETRSPIRRCRISGTSSRAVGNRTIQLGAAVRVLSST